MCHGIKTRAHRPRPRLEATTDTATPTTSAPPPAGTGCVIGGGCCVAWDVMLSGCARASSTQRQQQQAAPVVAVAAASPASFPTPPRATIRRLAATSRTRSKSDPSSASSLPDIMETILELDEVAARPSLLWRIRRTMALGGIITGAGGGGTGGGAGSAIRHAFDIDDGYDSEEDEEISEALFKEVGGDLAAARRRNYATLRWRAKHRIDEALEAPHADFEKMLACWPRWLQGTAKDGAFLWYERLGQVDAARLHRERLSHHGAWSEHVGLLCEYITRVLDPTGAWRDPYAATPRPAVTVVLDLEGMGAGKWADLAVRRAVRAWGDVLASHYPGLVTRVLVVNCPAYSPATLALLQPLLLFPRTLRAVVRVVNGGTGKGNGLGLGLGSSNGGGWGAAAQPPAPLAALTDAIDPLALPVTYPGGENPQAPESAPEWKDLLRLLRRNRRFHYLLKREGGEGAGGESKEG